MKKLSLLAVLLCMALSLTACVNTEVDEYYQSAQLYLGCGDYEYAAELFSQLGEYEESAEYALYSRALQAVEEEDYALARANLNAVNPFKSSGRYLMYLDALAAEEKNELDKALSLYEKLGTFRDAHLAAQRLREAIPEAAVKEGRALMAKGEYEAARKLFLSLDGYGVSKTLADNCTAALNKAAYTDADKLCDAGDLLGAMEAFTALGDTLDAAKRAEACLAAIHKQLDARYAVVALAEAPALIEDYAKLGADKTAQERIAELKNRYGKNLVLTGMEQPIVELGMYPGAESGEEQPVCWRVVKLEGSTVTLLSENVLDASAEAKPVTLNLKPEEQEAAGDVQLPAMTELAGLAEMACPATPYAVNQGAAAEDGMAAYWLRDSLENGVHPVIGAAGSMAVPAAGETAGIRLMTTLNLEKLTFADGSGTAEDPFRTE